MNANPIEFGAESSASPIPHISTPPNPCLSESIRGSSSSTDESEISNLKSEILISPSNKKNPTAISIPTATPAPAEQLANRDEPQSTAINRNGTQ
jgi:hypothetical protein